MYKNVKMKIYKIIILLVVFYLCGISSLSLREENTLKVSEEMVQSSLFGPVKDEIIGG
jgi:hypothetical protein